MTRKQALDMLAEKAGVPANVVDKAYKAYWRAVREKISSLPLKDDLTREEFSKLRTNVNVPSIGKLVCTYDLYLSTKERYKNIQVLRDRDD